MNPLSRPRGSPGRAPRSTRPDAPADAAFTLRPMPLDGTCRPNQTRPAREAPSRLGGQHGRGQHGSPRPSPRWPGLIFGLATAPNLQQDRWRLMNAKRNAACLLFGIVLAGCAGASSPPSPALAPAIAASPATDAPTEASTDA